MSRDRSRTSGNSKSQPKSVAAESADLELHSATVSFCSRRTFGLVTETGEHHTGKTLSKHAELTVGDKVKFYLKDGAAAIHEISKRDNLLWRSYFDRIKIIAANIDHIFIVTAYDSTYNSLFIDKVSLIAQLQGIPFTIIFNKTDLKLQEHAGRFMRYKRIGFSAIEMSARPVPGNTADNGSGHYLSVAEFRKDYLDSCNTVVFCGVSGAGKSSLLNALIPGANQITQEVSEKTGQGRQTTTLAKAHVVDSRGKTPLLIVDTPGIQNYGLSLLEIRDIQQGFPEIVKLAANCKFSDCLHYTFLKNSARKNQEFNEGPADEINNFDNIYSRLKTVILNDHSLAAICAVRRHIEQEAANMKDTQQNQAQRDLIQRDLAQNNLPENTLSFDRYLSYCHILEEANQMPSFEKNLLKASKLISD